MKILAHRGYWLEPEEKNSLIAFERAFSCGFGIETDVRDYKGELVISHNIADDECIPFYKLLKMYKEMKCESFIAINIKSDGIQDLLMDLLVQYEIENYFVFDMSIPEMVVYRNKKMKYFTRQSEYEVLPVLLENATGIWMDEWESSWISQGTVEDCLSGGKYVSIISSEIHGGDNTNIKRIIKNVFHDNLFVCTDVPNEYL